MKYYVEWIIYSLHTFRVFQSKILTFNLTVAGLSLENILRRLDGKIAPRKR